jgi:hypothetical protein
MRASGNVHTEGVVTVQLAEAYGFCWGVERAVQMAYEARQRYPDRQLHITNEIIHNPGVNAVRPSAFMPGVPPSASYLSFLSAHTTEVSLPFYLIGII